MTKQSRFTFLPLACIMMFAATTATSCGSSSDAVATDSTTVGDTSFTQIFDGKTFAGWEADTAVWRIEDGSFVGEVSPEKQIKTNSFLIWAGGSPADFEFKAEYKISKGGNSGVQYRSEAVPDIPYAVKGYQADIDGENTYTGQNYEERGRGFLAMRGQRATLETGKSPIISADPVGNSDELKSHIKQDDWNEIHLVVKGNNMKHYINGVLMSETTDNDSTNAKSSGLLGLQVHVSERMKVEYRGLVLRKL
jgi:hypothetical protein